MKVERIMNKNNGRARLLIIPALLIALAMAGCSSQPALPPNVLVVTPVQTAQAGALPIAEQRSVAGYNAYIQRLGGPGASTASASTGPSPFGSTQGQAALPGGGTTAGESAYEAMVHGGATTH